MQCSLDKCNHDIVDFVFPQGLRKLCDAEDLQPGASGGSLARGVNIFDPAGGQVRSEFGCPETKT